MVVFSKQVKDKDREIFNLCLKLWAGVVVRRLVFPQSGVQTAMMKHTRVRAEMNSSTLAAYLYDLLQGLPARSLSSPPYSQRTVLDFRGASLKANDFI